MRITLAQINLMVGDLRGNADKMIETIQSVKNETDIIIFPELALLGYPPEDLLLRPDLYRMSAAHLQRIADACQHCYALVGHAVSDDGKLYNATSVLHAGKVLAEYRKECLPNYLVFDEKRYFTADESPCVIDIQGQKVGLLICEDLWFPEPIAKAKAAGAEIILSPNASPYHYDQQGRRLSALQQRAKEQQLPIVYVNHVCGQDDLVFDGRSMIVDADGQLSYRAPAFEECIVGLSFDENWHLIDPPKTSTPNSLEADIYSALVLGVRDYVQKNGFRGAVIGLSGGIDSALTLAVAVDALGAENVQAVMMPFRYTSSMSIDDAEEEAKALGVEFDILSIEPIYESFMATLDQKFAGLPVDTTEQNIQARCRGTLLMAISNKSGRIVLTTGNKSEVAVGYCTLYGDMAGGFDVLKDIPKMMVYRLSEYRNTINSVIPRRVIERAPSAELAPDQKDEDNLPPYPVLDAILHAYVEEDKSLDEVIAMGFDETDVRRVFRLVDISEHKRRQAPPGIRITPRAFGRDRRYPITSGFGRQW